MGNGRSSPWGGGLSVPGGTCVCGHKKAGPRMCLTPAALAALPASPVSSSLWTLNPVIPWGLARVTWPVCTSAWLPSDSSQRPCCHHPQNRLRTHLVPVVRPCPGKPRCKREAEGCGGREPRLLKRQGRGHSDTEPTCYGWWSGPRQPREGATPKGQRGLWLQAWVDREKEGEASSLEGKLAGAGWRSPPSASPDRAPVSRAAPTSTLGVNVCLAQ